MSSTANKSMWMHGTLIAIGLIAGTFGSHWGVAFDDESEATQTDSTPDHLREPKLSNVAEDGAIPIPEHRS